MSRPNRMGLNQNDLKAFLADLKLIALPSKKKREILIRTLQMIKRNAVKNASNQNEPDGKRWKKRKNGTAKMLRRIAKLANSKADLDSQGRLYYRQQKTAQIAQEHQQGIDHLFRKRDFAGANKGGSASDPATPRQAKKLRDLGYTVPNGKKKNGAKSTRRPSLSEIKSTLTRARAGLIIRKLEEKYGKGANKNLSQWIIPTEKRSFLDVRAEENAKILLQEIKKYK